MAFQELELLARNLRLLLLDVDGVMTDGGIILIGEEMEAKRFDVHDGIGVGLAKASGIKVGIVTARDSRVVERRAAELGVDLLFQGVGSKIDVLDGLLRRCRIDHSQVAYIGDDIQDLSIMQKVGLPIAVGNAVRQIKECSVYVTTANGGHGAVREAVEWLLELRDQKANRLGGDAGGIQL